MLTLDQYTMIQTLHQQGWQIKRLCRELGLARNTIRRALRKGYQRQRIRNAPTLLSFYQGWIGQRASEVGYNAVRLHEDLRLKGYRGSYETVKLAVRPLRERERLKQEATMRFETPPGQQAQVDWGSSGVYFGEAQVRVHFFVLTLGYSRRLFVEGTLDEKLSTFLSAHEHAFEWFAGIPKEILYDNPKTVVVQHDSKGRVLRWNSVFLDFMDYYGVIPKVCPLYRARTKGKTESGVKYVKRNFLVGRTFRDLEDLNEQLREWIKRIADVRVHGTTHQRPLDRFKEEAKALFGWGSRPLYVLPQRLERVVASDCLVEFQTNRYSVPAEYVGQEVQLRLVNSKSLEIYQKGQLLATHPRAKERFRWVVDPAHWMSLNRGVAFARQTALMKEPSGLVRDLKFYQELLP